MIRLAEVHDAPNLRDCAEQAYARYVPVIGRKPAPMVADFAAQSAVGVVRDSNNCFPGHSHWN